MYDFVFVDLLPRMGFMGRCYTTALLPGVLAISLTFSSIQSVALPMVQDFGWTKEIEDRLLAPLPIVLVAAEKIVAGVQLAAAPARDRKSTRLNSSHRCISYAVFCLK